MHDHDGSAADPARTNAADELWPDDYGAQVLPDGCAEALHDLLHPDEPAWAVASDSWLAWDPRAGTLTGRVEHD